MKVRLIPVSQLDDSSRIRMTALIATKRGRTLASLDSGEWDKQLRNRFGYVVFDDSLPDPVGIVVCDGEIKLGVEPSWWIAPEYENKGYGSCAGKLLAEEAFRLGYRQRTLIHYDTCNYEKSRHIGDHFIRRFEELQRESSIS